MSNKEFFKDFDIQYFEAKKLRSKVDKTIENIQKTLEPFSKISLSCSGGKDSQLCLMLCAEAGIDFDVAFLDSDYNFPETPLIIERLCDKYNKKLIKIPYDVDLLQVYIELGVYYDNGKKQDALDIFQQSFYAHNKKYEVNVTGIRKMESRLRNFILSRSNGFEYSKKRETHFFSPICDYRNNDVYACITALGEEYHDIYYRAKDLKEREWRRVNWYVNTNCIEKGTVHQLKKEYPELYYKLVAKVPYLRTHV